MLSTLATFDALNSFAPRRVGAAEAPDVQPNFDFSAFTAGVPDSWTVIGGAGSSGVAEDINGVQITFDGSNIIGLYGVSLDDGARYRYRLTAHSVDAGLVLEFGPGGTNGSILASESVSVSEAGEFEITLTSATTGRVPVVKRATGSSAGSAVVSLYRVQQA